MAGLVGQTGFFPGDRRLRELDLLGDGLPLLNRLIPWERFRPILESVPKAKCAFRRSWAVIPLIVGTPEKRTFWSPPFYPQVVTMRQL
ncbi:hypothetical protein F6A13_10745 [Acidithiobacillus sp. 'AMD consortium']|jgi:hypothetical protein|uniref:hypothetical protein n=1 Tax=Acidithiobacillus TaxID=119977 RepID=UPI00124F5283|nr:MULTISPECIES: hypothetical protein [Acidithiobacillus]MBU2773475.1 hypothetical protein [Acidithiobacillus ferrooxidans]MBU2807263.1 hypothetical protein [Acidithiobacillus ferrooxidans F221]MCR1345141.1 hypothetical protein [Acidithiobacillus ferrooxidans]MCR1353811.1 hypothetical protein [Acidithiobacillus ferrooxidans]QFG79047.1 hypothetical protein F6A13_10745 [Acidithiobacillus sp. 'AMD consortium']